MTGITKNYSIDNTDDINSHDWMVDFQTIYQNLSKHNLASLEAIYHKDICFEDPLHKVEGLDNFIAYFDNLYSNIVSCQFDIEHIIQSKDDAAVYWVMNYQHPQLNSGKNITVSGHSHLKAKNNLIYYHRDYVDTASMLYEHIPLLGKVIRFLKKRVQS